jgi:phospho-N-acetylmuramoyl-pentapeptide-transferase
MTKESLLMALVVIILSFSLTYVFSIICIKYLKVLTSKIKPELADVHSHKEGTPNVGGIAFLCGSILASFIVFSFNQTAKYIMFSTLLFALLGFLDDIQKINANNGDGLSTKTKAGLQMIIAFIIAAVGDYYNLTNIGIKYLYQDGFLYTVIRLGLTTFFLAYFVNAFNITDGLDGLLGTIALPIFILIIMVLLSIPNHTVTMLLGVSMFGAVLCFLYFNRHPASYFMGDCGAMGLGAFLSVMALNLNIVPFFLIATLMFSIELFSSLIQIISIRKFGKKVFEIAPIHHMYQKRGINEPSIVSQFARYSSMFSILAFFLYAIIKL